MTKSSLRLQMLLRRAGPGRRGEGELRDPPQRVRLEGNSQSCP